MYKLEMPSINQLVKENGASQVEWEKAKEMDKKFLKQSLRNDFFIPKSKKCRKLSCFFAQFLGQTEEEFVYICGNSLGPQPKSFNKFFFSESESWAQHAVNGHLDNPSGRNWVDFDSMLLEDFKNMVGATDVKEVAVNSSLTTNLHNLMIHFYKPTKERFKIITDSMSFPSDFYALESQIKLHGLDPKEALIEVQPRNSNDKIIEEEDIINTIRAHGSSVALIMFSGIQYLSGQFFDLKAISKVGREVGSLVAFDLAHAIGNVPINLEELDADFAVWCTYKYLSSGPGGVGGYYVNRRHNENIQAGNGAILAGWWGVDLKKRFLMKHEFEPYEGARAFQQSCTPVFNSCGILASMESFKKMSMETIRERSFKLTEYFRELFDKEFHSSDKIRIITPKEMKRSGAQISLAFKDQDLTIATFKGLSSLGVMTDRREPDIIRLTFTGVYNSYEDVFLTIEALKHLL